MSDILLCAILSLLCVHTYVLIILYLRSKPKPEKPKQEQELTQDATALLGELAHGRAVVIVDVIDPADIWYKSPKRRN